MDDEGSYGNVVCIVVVPHGTYWTTIHLQDVTPILLHHATSSPCSSVDIVLIVGGGARCTSSLPPHPICYILILNLHCYHDESYVCGLVVVLTNCRSEISYLYIFDGFANQLDDRCRCCCCCCCVYPSSIVDD